MRAGNEKIEGKGFKSPEEALSTYIKAFEARDIDAMLSCFAIESYSEHYKLEEWIDLIGSYSATNTALPFPQTGDYSQSLAVKAREANVIKEIQFQYIALLTDPDSDIGRPVSTNEYDGKTSKLVDDLFIYEDSELFDDFKFKGKFEDPSDIDDKYDDKAVRKNRSKKADSIGADELESAVAEFEAFGDDYYMFAEAVEYGGTWYLLSVQSSTISNLLGLNVYAGGIVLQDDIDD